LLVQRSEVGNRRSEVCRGATIGRPKIKLEDNDTTLTLLAKYSLSNTANASGHYMQLPNAIGDDTDCMFSYYSYWVDDWEEWDENWTEGSENLNLNDIEVPITGEYAETINTSAILKAKDYAKVVTGDEDNETGRLLTYAEFDRLQYDYAEMIGGTENQMGSESEESGLYYFLSTAGAGNEWMIKIVYCSCYAEEDYLYLGAEEGNGPFEQDGVLAGVRPVITVNKSIGINVVG